MFESMVKWGKVFLVCTILFILFKCSGISLKDESVYMVPSQNDTNEVICGIRYKIDVTSSFSIIDGTPDLIILQVTNMPENSIFKKEGPTQFRIIWTPVEHQRGKNYTITFLTTYKDLEDKQQYDFEVR